MFWPDSISKILEIKYPIIQAPMFGVSTPQMAVAVAKAGCLGSLALADLSADKSAELIRETRKLTDQSFAVNIFVHDIPELTESLREKFIKTKQFITDLAKENHIEVKLPDLEEIKLNSYHDQVEAVIEEGCKVLSFTFGNLDEKSIERLKENGVTLIGTCTSLQEALVLEKSGIDIICVQGIEAGGHRGTFEADHIPEIGGISLLSQVYDHIKVPLIYAGGMYNGKTLRAAKELGAQGFQVGSMLLASQESALQPFEKEKLKNVTGKDIVLTKSFSGRYARGIKNKFIESIEDSGYIMPYPYQNKLTNELRRVSKTFSNSDFVSIWAGQSVHDYSMLSTENILTRLISAAEAGS
ncbi:nitronate monooxygenase [Chryseobacterium oranimense]|uniref:NAD(P)H-dependent flavin oxidoreductase n=1 Tax=Chryseobacterium oranimense TaxID=421058 RepID=UPI0021AFFB2C|nr:nitronate monooxygenase [Chryseobacterium oranimense]UWX58942.1 nitronate monooxygenase [Chryseobacterium oranimense]